jgi:hypothetical protein
MFPSFEMVDHESSYILGLMGFSLTKIVFDRMITEMVEDQQNNNLSKANKRKRRLQNKKVFSERKSGFMCQINNQESMIIKEIEREENSESKSCKKKKSKSRSKSITIKDSGKSCTGAPEPKGDNDSGKKKKKRKNKANKIRSHNVVRRKDTGDIKILQCEEKNREEEDSKSSHRKPTKATREKNSPKLPTPPQLPPQLPQK